MTAFRAAQGKGRKKARRQSPAAAARRLTLFFLGGFALAAEAAEGGGFPAKSVFFQAFNFLIFVWLFARFAGQPLRRFLARERESFLLFERQARARERELDKSLGQWKKKLADLKERERGIQKKASQESRLFLEEKKRALKEEGRRMDREAEFLLRLELEKARRALFEKGKKKIAAMAEAMLRAEAGDDFQKSGLAPSIKQIEGLRPPAGQKDGGPL